MKKLLTLGVASLAVVGVVGIGTMSVSALNGQGNQSGIGLHAADGSGYGNGNGNGYQTSLESRATVLGMTAEQLRTALETKTMSQLALDKGLSEADFQAKMQTAATARWEARGLSDSEIAQRTADQAQRHETNSADHEFGSGDGNHQAGYGRNQ